MLTPFHVDTTYHHEKLLVNGVDLIEQGYRIKRVTVDAQHPDPPRLYIEIIGEGVIEGEGIVHQVQPAQDQRELVQAFLHNIDPQELERRVLDRGGSFSATETTGQAFLATLLEWVSGDSNGS